MKTLRVLLIGAAGRMGKTIVDLASRASDIEIVAQCDLGDAIEPAMKNCDVAIDFSHADAIEEICRAALQHRQPLVIGTTGHSTAQRQEIEKAGQSVPIVFASNFSIGVNALFALTHNAAEILGDEFGLEIIETHHRMKKDAPSGTAKTLAEILKKARKIDNEVPTRSIREGDVVGEHTVVFAGPGERLELTHRASSREIFARGALRAAQWIIGKPPGLYSMQDVLGL
ncbi:MAG TPA: 4-hydroxy-tetrahydrodipicolinate reductase [Spartobacteria bacterium]|nr:4-hydroxy-tetrahydrodipicolinate reductase [Spartobacteria bacterium]HCP92043.1 4-hydroxy-tetrahydrodipicolinate reductase [Spartobacteria bacterium]